VFPRTRGRPAAAGYLLDELLRLSGQRVTLSSPAIWFAFSCAAARAGRLVGVVVAYELRDFGLLVAPRVLLLMMLVLLVKGPAIPDWSSAA